MDKSDQVRGVDEKGNSYWIPKSLIHPYSTDETARIWIVALVVLFAITIALQVYQIFFLENGAVFDLRTGNTVEGRVLELEDAVLANLLADCQIEGVLRQSLQAPIITLEQCVEFRQQLLEENDVELSLPHR